MKLEFVDLVDLKTDLNGPVLRQVTRVMVRFLLIDALAENCHKYLRDKPKLGGNVVEADKCMNVSQLLGAPVPLPKVYTYRLKNEVQHVTIV